MKFLLVSAVMFALIGQGWAQDRRPLPRPDRGVAANMPVASGTVPIAQPATVVVSSKSPTPRPTNLLRGLELRLALSAARDGDWQTAGALAAAKGPVAATIVEWQRLRSGKGSFADYRAFVAANPGWPGLEYLRKRGEASVGTDAAPEQVIAYFADNPPQTGGGALALAAAYFAKSEKARAEAVLIAAWTGLELSEAEEKVFLEKHGDLLKPHHEARVDYLLWQGERAAATRLLSLVDDDYRALAMARLALQRKAGNVDAMINAVPANLSNDPGLGFDRMAWQIAKKRRDKAADMIIAASASDASLGRPEAWGNWRRVLARQAMRGGDGEKAYALASKHHLTSGSDYADLEWLSGYLALTYLKKPELALSHFKAFGEAVFSPISLGRAYYWQGRAYEALGDKVAAQAAYTEGAVHQTTFYGLLAAEKAGIEMDGDLTGLAKSDLWQDASFTNSTVFQAAAMFNEADQPWETIRFLNQLAESLSEPDLVKLTDYTLTLGNPFIAVRVSKQAAYTGTVAPRAYFPLTPMGGDALPIPAELALSIARRESEFHAAAVSGAGARGLMQLMPGTAKQMAGRMGLPYSQGRLTSDPDYNIRLGSAYLAQLIEEFGNNIVLVAVGYNAGPSRARSWIKSFGDPRDPAVDVVDWIEHIPFNETQNYVMRIAESLPVYRARLSGRVAPIALTAELKKR